MTLDLALAFFAFLAGFLPPLSIAAADAAWAGLALAGLAGLAMKKEKLSSFRTPMDVPLLAYLAVWLAASLLGLDPLGSLKRFPSLLHVTLFYLLAGLSSGRHARTAFQGYLWGAGTAVFYGLAQFVLWTLVYPHPHTEGFPAWFQSLNPSLQNYLALHGDRAAGAIQRVHGAVHPLTYAELLLPAFFVFTANFLDAENARRRLLWLGALFGTGTALLLSQSRGPWLGALAGLLVMALFHRRKYWLLGPLALLALVLVLTPATRRRFVSLTGKCPDVSVETRFELWKSGFFIARKNPLLGVGPGMVRRAVETYRAQPGFTAPPDRFAGDMHNLYLQQLVCKGALGLATLLVLLGLPLRAALKQTRALPEHDPGRTRALALLAFFAAFLIVNLTERAFEDGEVALVFWILTANILPAANGKRPPPALT